MKDLPALLEAPTNGTVIAPNISFKGQMEITGDDPITINGLFEGEIIALSGTVYVGSNGVLRGTVKAAKVIVAGQVDQINDADHIEATEYLAIAEGGTVTSNEINYGQIAMELGAVVHGRMRPSSTRKAFTATPEKPVAAAPVAAPETARVLMLDRSAAAAAPHAQSVHTAVEADDALAHARTGTHDVLTPLGT